LRRLAQPDGQKNPLLFQKQLLQYWKEMVQLRMKGSLYEPAIHSFNRWLNSAIRTTFAVKPSDYAAGM
jgi:hypothetical protein